METLTSSNGTVTENAASLPAVQEPQPQPAALPASRADVQPQRLLPASQTRTEIVTLTREDALTIIGKDKNGNRTQRKANAVDMMGRIASALRGLEYGQRVTLHYAHCPDSMRPDITVPVTFTVLYAGHSKQNGGRFVELFFFDYPQTDGTTQREHETVDGIYGITYRARVRTVNTAK